RWFCEGRELQNSPDIQIWREGDLHTLVIAEAFEDDTGRYTCVASNSLGADNTSAEVYIEASSSDSEGEGTASKSRSGAMPAQRKTTSMSLTIRSSSPKTPEVLPHRSALVQSMSQPPQRLLQDVQASEGQVVVLECRVRGSPPLQVQWYRQGNEILDSPDFRILQKEICTLVIAEAFPEDGGLFFCKASNAFGSVSSTAQLIVNPAEDSSSNGMSGDSSGFEDAASFPPPPPPPSPPPTEISLLELPPKALPQPGLDAFRVKELELWPSASVPPLVQISSEVEDGDKERGQEPLQNGQHPPSPPSLPKDAPLPPPPPNAAQLKQLQDQILLEQQEAAIWQQQPEHIQEVPPPPLHLLQEAPPPAPPSPPLPPPPSFQELESSTAMQASTFNYARPKQFIAAQSPGGAGYVAHSSGSSGSSLSSPLSPPASHKPLNRVALPPFTKAGSVESPTSPSFPPPPPPFLSLSNLSSPSGSGQDFPPPPPPPPPPVSMSPVGSDVSSPFSSVPPSPASSFLSSVLPSSPSTPGSPMVNSLGLPKGNGTKVFPRKSSVTKTPRIVSDSDIQGSKDAVIQDLERKLRFKEERMSNGQQRLTYEEKMARRLLGADNAATVLNTQDTEEEPVTQEYRVSSFEQRLISEIEYRLERSPVEESDDDVQHDEDSAGQGVAPSFDQKLKHYKVFEGMPVTFSCKVHGEPQPKVYWFKDGKQISKRSEHYRISRDPDGTCSLHTAAASLDDDGNYTILAANPDQGRVSCTGRMMVQAVNQRGRSPRMAPGHMRPRSRSRDSGDENDNIQERHFRPHFLQAPGDLIVQEGRLCRMDCKMQDGSWNQPLPISVLLKDPAAGGTSEGDAGVFSEASSDGELYLDSSTELDSGHGDFADLTAFLSAEEINLSLDLAREAFGEADECEDQDPSSLKQLEQVLQSVPSPLVVPSQTTENLNSSPNLHHQTKAVCSDDNGAVSVSSNQIAPISKPIQISSEAPSSAEKVVRHKPIQPVYKQDKPRLVHEGLELNDRAASVTEFCSRAATFIEELSSIFKGSAQPAEEESSSPDSGYLSPRSQRTVPQGSVSTSSLPAGPQEDTHNNPPEMGQGCSERHLHAGASAASEPLSPPQFLQKLKSQEVAEGSPIRLECRVQGNPLPLV
uniref:Palladin, cytoskeletal associated protein n=1 Tax=Xiphophorus couchianus TaxID=32473 RepID=A0A3B5LKF0_9TELE